MNTFYEGWFDEKVYTHRQELFTIVNNMNSWMNGMLEYVQSVVLTYGYYNKTDLLNYRSILQTLYTFHDTKKIDKEKFHCFVILTLQVCTVESGENEKMLTFRDTMSYLCTLLDRTDTEFYRCIGDIFDTYLLMLPALVLWLVHVHTDPRNDKIEAYVRKLHEERGKYTYD